MYSVTSRRPVLAMICMVGVSAALPAAALGGIDVQMNPTDNTLHPNTVQNEVSLTLNPATAGNVVVSYNDGIYTQAISGLGVSYSTNSGASWTERQLSVPNHPVLGTGDDMLPMGFIFDPVSGADTQGRVYAGYIASPGGPNTASGVYVEYSDDGGNSWSGPVTVAFNQSPVYDLPPNYRFNDKPHLTVDRSAASSHTDRVYMGWIRDDAVNPQGDILLSASGDRGVTWYGTPPFWAPVMVSDNPGTDMANGPNVATAPDGTVYVAWLNVDVTVLGSKPGTLMLDKSTDGGATFGTDIAVRAVRTLPKNLSNMGGVQDARANGYGSIAVDPGNSQVVYMVYPADPDYVGPGNDGADEADVYFIKSTDGGSTWSTPLRLNDDNTTNDQFAPWIAVKPDGTIDVAWYDSRNDNGTVQWDVFIAKSTDGGANFSSNLRVTDSTFATPNTTGGPWFGEYLGLAADSTHAYVGFASSITDANNGDVYFDRLGNSQIPEPASAAVLLAGLPWLLRRRRRR